MLCLPPFRSLFLQGGLFKTTHIYNLPIIDLVWLTKLKMEHSSCKTLTSVPTEEYNDNINLPRLQLQLPVLCESVLFFSCCTCTAILSFTACYSGCQTWDALTLRTRDQALFHIFSRECDAHYDSYSRALRAVCVTEYAFTSMHNA